MPSPNQPDPALPEVMRVAYRLGSQINVDLGWCVRIDGDVVGTLTADAYREWRTWSLTQESARTLQRKLNDANDAWQRCYNATMIVTRNKH